MAYKYIFGPVPSRRLGVSLGIDLIPHKTCSFDCIYCECGRTTFRTVRRKEFVPVKEVTAELRDYLSSSPVLDYVTFAGSGEPTLHSGIGKVISFIKKNYSGYRVCVLTNGSLLHIKSVRRSIRKADLVIPSLDTAHKEIFDRINRPHPALDLNRIIKGIELFSREYTGKLEIEVFLLKGINDSEKALKKLKIILGRIRHDCIQLNSLSRPGAEKRIKALSQAQLKTAAEILKPLNCEITRPFRKKSKNSGVMDNSSGMIVTIVKRRPVTIPDLAVLTGLRESELSKYAELLCREGRVVFEKQRGKYFLKGVVK